MFGPPKKFGVAPPMIPFAVYCLLGMSFYIRYTHAIHYIMYVLRIQLFLCHAFDAL